MKILFPNYSGALVHDIMPGTEEQLLKEMTTTYIGFDPTSDSCILGV
jgi:tyrosyl-tRNA synthetase